MSPNNVTIQYCCVNLPPFSFRLFLFLSSRTGLFFLPFLFFSFLFSLLFSLLHLPLASGSFPFSRSCSSLLAISWYLHLCAAASEVAIYIRAPPRSLLLLSTSVSYRHFRLKMNIPGTYHLVLSCLSAVSPSIRLHFGKLHLSCHFGSPVSTPFAPVLR